MKKKQFKYSDLTTKELELLKNTYIDLKVKSMNNNDLKDFAIQNISLQIKNTIGNEEELEAWHEMEEFFKDEFEKTILDIQFKMKSNNDEKTNLNAEKIKFENENKDQNKKLDMWED
tara:strand:+ start:333 stop:683 length:351 start_codon:yes stop_codon:yes gene_type:complete